MLDRHVASGPASRLTSSFGIDSFLSVMVLLVLPARASQHGWTNSRRFREKTLLCMLNALLP